MRVRVAISIAADDGWRKGERLVLDIYMIALAIAFFVACIAYIRACELL